MLRDNRRHRRKVFPILLIQCIGATQKRSRESAFPKLLTEGDPIFKGPTRFVTFGLFHHASSSIPHRARAAFTAIERLSSAVSDAARALPPTLPPLRPSATA